MAYPTVYPTGTTIYEPDSCWNGYTVFQANETGAVVLDMNGNVVQFYRGLHGFPNKILPGGYVMGSSGERNRDYGFQDQIDLVQVDWEGNIVWKFNRYEYIEDQGEKPEWMARQHHDYQREGNPVGYYVPGMDPLVDRGNTIMLSHKNIDNPGISNIPLHDDVIIEVTWHGDIVWEWVCSDHFDELGFDKAARDSIARYPNIVASGGGTGDWMHINSMSIIGPNRWYDTGDARFHPDNIIWDSRETNIIGIINKKTGKIVWQIGPYYDTTPELRNLGQIIGQHHAHMIPRGLPGEGNILVFDNGGCAGYGAPHPSSPKGHNHVLRDYSRVLEFNPVTLEIVWQYSAVEAGFEYFLDSSRFYSCFVSSAQRLPNGNTLITEGADGRIFEVTPDHRIVWEYISPFWGRTLQMNMVYRAYRAPYEWIPQLEKPEETAITHIDNTEFQVEGSGGKVPLRTTEIEGVRGYSKKPYDETIPPS
jgi:hypothetical protein